MRNYNSFSSSFFCPEDFELSLYPELRWCIGPAIGGGEPARRLITQAGGFGGCCVGTARLGPAGVAGGQYDIPERTPHITYLPGCWVEGQEEVFMVRWILRSFGVGGLGGAGRQGLLEEG